MLNKIRQSIQFWHKLVAMLVGIPDYDNYVSHMLKQHPDTKIMNKKEFIRNRVDARYGGGEKGKITRCC